MVKIAKNPDPKNNVFEKNDVSKEKTSLTDVELCCSIILCFYHHPKKDMMLEQEIYDWLCHRHVLEKERVRPMLKKLHKQWLVGFGTAWEVIDGKRYEEEHWNWTIRMDETGEWEGHPWHYGKFTSIQNSGRKNDCQSDPQIISEK